MLVTVARYYDPTEAQIVRSLLESAGIPASVAEANHITANWPIAVALGGVRVQVPSSHHDQARDLVSAYTSGELQTDLEQEVGDLSERCPSCGSNELSKRVSAQEKLLAIVVFLFGSVPFQTRTSSNQCKKCRYAWQNAG
jgi:hypothetical protein